MCKVPLNGANNPESPGNLEHTEYYTPFNCVKSSLICGWICHHFIYILYPKEIYISGSKLGLK